MPGRRLTSLTIKVDSEVLVHARMRALFEGTNVSRLLRAVLDDYSADSRRRFRDEHRDLSDEDAAQAVP
jgi:hypothetical protein